MVLVRLIRLKVTCVSGVVAEHRLAHQQLVEIRVDERADDRVDLPFVVPDAGGDIDHDVPLKVWGVRASDRPKGKG